MKELLIFGITFMIVYLIYVRLRYKMTFSISATYYELKNKWFFTIAMWGFALPFMIVAAKGLFFLAGAGICFVGAAPRVGEKYQISKWVHLAGSYIGVGLGTLAFWIYYGMWWVPLIQLAFTVPAMKYKLNNHTYWIEFLAIMLVTIHLYLVKFV